MAKYYRANNKKGYLNARILPSDTQLELQTIDYGGGAKDRNIPTIVDKLMRLVIWGIQYPNPSAAPDKEIISATWTGSGQVFDIVRAQEGTKAKEHYIGDNIALLLTADLSREILIFEDFEDSPDGSIAYTDDVDADGNMEVVALLPDDEVSIPEGYRKVLVSGGDGDSPYWQFVFASEVGASKAEEEEAVVVLDPFYIGTDESPSGDDLFEVDYDWVILHQDEKGQAVNGVYDIRIQPSTGRIIVSGSSTYIYESDWTYVNSIPQAGTSILIDPDDDDYIYICGPGGIYKYKISTQVQQWSNITYSAYGICISSDTGKLYICGIIGDGINEISRSDGTHVRNLELARGHGRIAYYNEHLYATGSRQSSKSIWKYNEASGALITSYDTGGGTNRVIIFEGNIFVCGQRSNSYNPAGGITGYKTIFRFSENLFLESAYDDGNSVYWLNDMEIDFSQDYLVVGSNGNAVDENGNTANLRWFDVALQLIDHARIYDSVSNSTVTAFITLA